MRLSNSEFLSLVKRALEGSGWTAGRYEEPASAIWWLQSRGIDWLERFTDVWPRLKSTEAATPELLESHAANSVIDAGRSSLLHCAPNSIDLAFANSCVEPIARVEVRNCLDRILIIYGLSVLARRGASALARWYSDRALHIAYIDAEQRYPEYAEYAVPPDFETQLNSITLVCSREKKGMNHYQRNLSKLARTEKSSIRLTPEHFRKSAAHSRTYGVEVSDDAMRLLQEAERKVLVATSEQSREETG